MNRIIDYKIVYTKIDIRVLRVKVNAEINEGWQPIGGASIAFEGRRGFYVQSMVRYESMGKPSIGSRPPLPMPNPKPNLPPKYSRGV